MKKKVDLYYNLIMVVEGLIEFILINIKTYLVEPRT